MKIEIYARENVMNMNELYKSRTNVTQTYYEWWHEAREFYDECDTNMPRNWWERWVKVLGLMRVEHGNNV